jgi:hypothetical protein
VWKTGEQQKVLRDLPDDILNVTDARTPVEPLSGEPVNVGFGMAASIRSQAVTPKYVLLATPQSGAVLTVRPTANGSRPRGSAPFTSDALDALLRTCLLMIRRR